MTVRRRRDRLRITTQPVDTSTGFHLWWERFDRQVTDVFEMQYEITRSIVDSLKLELKPECRGPRVLKPELAAVLGAECLVWRSGRRRR